MMQLTETQRAWLEANGIKAQRHYEGFLFFCPDAYGYALGSTVQARPRIDGTLWVEVRAKSVWNRATACYEFTAKDSPSLRAALAELCAERRARVAS